MLCLFQRNPKERKTKRIHLNSHNLATHRKNSRLRKQSLFTDNICNGYFGWNMSHFRLNLKNLNSKTIFTHTTIRKGWDKWSPLIAKFPIKPMNNNKSNEIASPLDVLGGKKRWDNQSFNTYGVSANRSLKYSNPTSLLRNTSKGVNIPLYPFLSINNLAV